MLWYCCNGAEEIAHTSPRICAQQRPATNTIISDEAECSFLQVYMQLPSLASWGITAAKTLKICLHKFLKWTSDAHGDIQIQVMMILCKAPADTYKL